MKFDRLDTRRDLGLPSVPAISESGSALADLVARFEAADPGKAGQRLVTTASLRAGRYIRAMRANAGLSQAQLAQRIAVSQARISELEIGMGKHGPSLDVFERIAAACGVQLVLAPIKRVKTG